MSENYELKNEEDKEEQKELDKIQNPPKSNSKKIQLPQIAGIFLIIAGVLAILIWLRLFTIDIEIIEKTMEIRNTDQLGYNITSQQIKSVYNICGTIGIIMSVLAILSGFLSINKKKWGIAFIGGIPLLIIILILFIVTIIAGIAWDLLVMIILLCLGIFIILKSKNEFR